jgi:hypothetical protein
MTYAENLDRTLYLEANILSLAHIRLPEAPYGTSKPSQPVPYVHTECQSQSQGQLPEASYFRSAAPLQARVCSKVFTMEIIRNTQGLRVMILRNRTTNSTTQSF